MKQILTNTAFFLAALAMPVGAAAQAQLEGRWANPHHSVIVKVARCGDAYCGTVGWANDKNRKKGVGPGTRVLSDLKPLGGGVYKGKAYEPKRGIGGSATVRQVSPDVMLVKGCVVAGLVCKEQRWTRVG
jgi:uncharacterized protein (DUF2147 family)